MKLGNDHEWHFLINNNSKADFLLRWTVRKTQTEKMKQGCMVLIIFSNLNEYTVLVKNPHATSIFWI